MAEAGADVNLENKGGLTSFEVNDSPEKTGCPVQQAGPAVINAFTAIGAQNFKRGANGEITVRGIADNRRGTFRTRFFTADDQGLYSGPRIEETFPLRSKVLASVPLETGGTAADVIKASTRALRISWTYDDPDEPANNAPFYIKNAGDALVLGKTGPMT